MRKNMPTELILNRKQIRLLEYIAGNGGMDVAMTQPKRGEDEPELHSMLPGCEYAYENRDMKEVLDDLEEDRLVEPSVVARYGTEGYCVVRYTLTQRGRTQLRMNTDGKRSRRDRTAD